MPKIWDDIRKALLERGWTDAEAEVIVDCLGRIEVDAEAVWYNIMAGIFDPGTPKGRRLVLLVYNQG